MIPSPQADKDTDHALWRLARPTAASLADRAGGSWPTAHPGTLPRALGAGTLAVALLAVGCAGNGQQRIEQSANLRTLTFAMDVNVNRNRPAAVELVRVADENLVDELLAIDTAAWFGGEGKAFRLANPSAVTDTWEVVPGSPSEPYDVSLKRGFGKRMLRRGKVAGVLYCDTWAPSPPSRIVRDGHVSVTVSDDGCALADPSAKRSLFSRLGRRGRTVSFAVASGANGNRPVTVALVATKDVGLVDELLRIDGEAWFAAAGTPFREANPDVIYEAWEVVPGDVHEARLAVMRGVTGVVFCGVPGAAALRLARSDWKRKVAIEVGDGGCRFSQGPTPAPGPTVAQGGLEGRGE